MCILSIILLALVFALAIFFLSGSTVENFTIAKRHGILCPPLLRKTLEDKLMPNSVVFVIQGYNYAETPILYRDGKKIVPLQYEWNGEAMAYYFTVAAPNGLCGSEWVLETSDFIEPVVNEGRSGEKIDVVLRRRRGGFNKWGLSCGV